MNDSNRKKKLSQLRAHLDQVFDADLAANMARNLTSQQSKFATLNPIEIGRAFYSYRIMMGDLECALKIPRHLMDRDSAPAVDKQWYESMKLLGKKPSDLIAPFKVVPFNGSYIQVMVHLKPEFTPTEDIAMINKELATDLAGHGLRNNDALQIGYYQGIPLALDLSEITRRHI